MSIIDNFLNKVTVSSIDDALLLGLKKKLDYAVASLEDHVELKEVWELLYFSRLLGESIKEEYEKNFNNKRSPKAATSGLNIKQDYE